MAENPREDPSAMIAPASGDACGEVNMEACVTADEVLRARGFGATDDLNRVIPVASDSTDYEDHLLKVQSYEDSEDNTAQTQILCPSDVPKVSDVINGGTTSSAKGCEAFVSDGVNMEASVNSDDMIRAGGFGATDNISSFLPVASDFTDFEAYLRDARDYEDLKEEIAHPGLGWSNETK